MLTKNHQLYLPNYKWHLYIKANVFRHQTYMTLKIHNPCANKVFGYYFILKLEYCKRANSIIFLTVYYMELLLERYHFSQQQLTTLFLKYKGSSSFWKLVPNKSKKLGYENTTKGEKNNKTKPSITREASVSCSSCAEQNNIILRHTTHEWKVNSMLAMQGTLFFTLQYFKSWENKRDHYI